MRRRKYEHRVVMERKLGRELTSEEIVHHIDGNKKNNHPDNLQVMTRHAHMMEHGLAIPGMALPWKPWTKQKKRRNPDRGTG